MNKQTPEPGDVWLQDKGHLYVFEVEGEKVWVTGPAGDLEGGPFTQLQNVAEFAFNLPRLLSGDPSAWAAALRFAPPEVVTSAVVAQCREDGRADDLDAAFDLKYARYFDQSGQRKVARNVLRRLGLSALLEDAGSEEGKPCEGF